MRYALALLGLVALFVASCAAQAPLAAPAPERSTATPESATPTPEPPAPTRKPLPRSSGELLPGEAPPALAENQFSTDFGRHSVPYSEIHSGGPLKDGIAALDAPKFVDVAEADAWLDDNEAVILVELSGDTRAYPVQILMFHEIVNDTIGGQPVTVTYCPLCNTGIAFERNFDDWVLDFGTTGYLRNSNMVMYDRQTETWWQQATGEGIVGEYTLRQLAFVPAALVSWADFKATHSQGTVLSRDTGYVQPYGLNPYSGYDRSQRPFLLDGPAAPEVLPLMERVLAVEWQDETVAYPYSVMQEERVANDSVGGMPIVVLWAPGTASALDAVTTAGGRDVGSATSFSRQLEGEVLTFLWDGERIVDEQSGSEWTVLGRATDGPRAGQELEPVVAVNHFWFSWYAFKPETRVYRPEGTAASEPAADAESEPTELENDFAIVVYQGADVLGGEATRLSSVLALGKPVVLNMWAALCPACRGELPRMQEMHEQYGDQVLFLGIDVGAFVGLGSQEDALQLLDQLQITYPVGTPVEGRVIRDYRVLGTPSTYFITPDGAIVQQWTGAMNETQLEGFIQTLLAAAATD